MAIRLSIAIMSHPSRAEQLSRLVAALEAEGAKPDVVLDPEPGAKSNPWRTARLAWARTPGIVSHRLVLQDDALICSGFVQGARAALAAKPDVPVSFFVNWIGHQLARCQLDACEQRSSWAQFPIYGWYPTVALCLPRELARGLGEYVPPGRQPGADDAITAKFLNGRRARCWQTVPSLVDHDESVPSLQGHAFQPRYRRDAACFIGDHNPSTIDWSR